MKIEQQQLNYYIRKRDDSSEWECGYLIHKTKPKQGEFLYIREVVHRTDSYEKANQWLNNQGK